MSIQKRHGREARGRWVSQWRASGMPAPKFATRHGLKESTLGRWIREFGEPSEESAAGDEFAEVVLRGNAARSAPGVIEIVLSHERAIRVEGHVDVAQLRAVVEVLESC